MLVRRAVHADGAGTPIYACVLLVLLQLDSAPDVTALLWCLVRGPSSL